MRRGGVPGRVVDFSPCFLIVFFFLSFFSLISRLTIWTIIHFNKGKDVVFLFNCLMRGMNVTTVDEGGIICMHVVWRMGLVYYYILIMSRRYIHFIDKYRLVMKFNCIQIV